MRRCPFCTAENGLDVSVCHVCGRRLPPLPPRTSAGSVATKGPAHAAQRAGTLPPPVPTRTPMVGLATPSLHGADVLAPSTPDDAEDQRRQLAHAIDPGPAAQRRDIAPEPRIVADRRRRSQHSPPPPVAASSVPEPRGAVADTAQAPPTHAAPGDARLAPPFSPPDVLPIPQVPEPGLVMPARYAYLFARGWWQRRGAIRQLGAEIRQHTEVLDQVLGALGRGAREARVEGRVFSGENALIANAEQRIQQFTTEHLDVESRKAEERSKFEEIERERNAKLRAAERVAEEASQELTALESERRTLRERRKDIDRRIKTHLKTAEDVDRQTSAATTEDKRQDLRNAAQGHRNEATALQSSGLELDRNLAALDRPIVEVAARFDASKAELDAAKRSLHDAREGHSHRLAELNSEQKRKAREISSAESEIARRLVTLGTLVNLNRIEDGRFRDLYRHIDELRDAITSRTAAIEKLTAEREAYDRGTLVRGVATIAGALLMIIALVVILLAVL